MKLSELQQKLSEYPPDTEVMVPGYEGGYHDNITLNKIEVVRDIHKEWYYGPHDQDYLGVTYLPKEEVLIIGHRCR